MSLLTASTTWFWAGIAILIGSVFLHEIRSRQPRTRIYRIGAYFVVLTALTALYLRPAIDQSQQGISYVLQRGHADTRILDSLYQSGYVPIKEIAEIDTARAGRLAVVGRALDDKEWARIRIPVTYFPPRQPEGIISISHTQALPGNPFMVSGRLHLKDSVSLILEHPDGTQSVQGASKSASSFEFELTVPNSGNYLFPLTGIRNSDTLFHENYAVSLQPPGNLQILLLASIPTFEQRFLKDMLVREGHSVTYQYEIIPNTPTRAFYNTSDKDFTLTPRSLDKFDLLILTPKLFDQLSSPIKTRIKARTFAGGLGVLFMGELSENELLGTLIQQPVKALGFQDILGDISVESRKFTSSDHQSITYQSIEIGGIRAHGLGWIGFANFPISYPLELKGFHTLYTSIWTRLLYQISPLELNPAWIEGDALPRVDEQLNFTVHTESERSELIVDESVLPLRERPLRPNTYEAIYWPPFGGWQTSMLLPDSITFPFYVYEENDWLAMRIFNDSAFMSRSIQEREMPEVLRKTISSPLPKWWFFLLFLLGVGYLWLDSRFTY